MRSIKFGTIVVILAILSLGVLANIELVYNELIPDYLDYIRSANQSGLIDEEWEFDNLTIRERLKFTEDNHFISKGYTAFFGIAAEMIAIIDLELHPQGEIITATIYAPNDNITDLIIGNFIQIGRNNSYSLSGNSQGIVRNDICQLARFNNGTHCNMSAISDYTIMCNEFNKTEEFNSPCEFFADTAGRGGPLLWTQGDLEVWREANIMEGIRARSMADFIDTDVDVLNGSFHSQIPVNCNLGTLIGVERKLVNENFIGHLGVFDNLQIDAGDWHAKSDARCDSDECANANGVGGVGNLIMQTNFSTLDFNQTGVSFVYSLTKFIASSSFTVTINNNSGSGDITLFTDTTDDVLLSSQYFAFPDGFDNVTKVSLNFECDVTKGDRLCFVDTIIVNATHTVNSTFSESRIASETCFDTGIRDISGRCIFGMYWEPCNQTLKFTGNVTETNIIKQTETIIGDFTVGGNLFVTQLSNCDTINTTSNGQFICGDDATGGGGVGGRVNDGDWDNSTGTDTFTNLIVNVSNAVKISDKDPNMLFTNTTDETVCASDFEFRFSPVFVKCGASQNLFIIDNAADCDIMADCWDSGDFTQAKLFLSDGLSTITTNPITLDVNTRSFNWNIECNQERRNHISSVKLIGVINCTINASNNMSNEQGVITFGNNKWDMFYSNNSARPGLVIKNMVSGDEAIYINNDNVVEMPDGFKTDQIFFEQGESSLIGNLSITYTGGSGPKIGKISMTTGNDGAQSGLFSIDVNGHIGFSIDDFGTVRFPNVLSVVTLTNILEISANPFLNISVNNNTLLLFTENKSIALGEGAFANKSIIGCQALGVNSSCQADFCTAIGFNTICNETGTTKFGSNSVTIDNEAGNIEGSGNATFQSIKGEEICINLDCRTEWPISGSTNEVMIFYVLNSMTKDVLWNISFSEEESYTFSVIGGSDIHPIKGEII